MVNNQTLLEMPPMELLEYMQAHYMLDLPAQMDDIDTMNHVSELLSVTTSNYAFLTNLTMLAKLKKREAKREKKSKEECEDALSREEIISKFADISKAYYNALSRMLTVKQQINQEMKMGM